MTASDLFGNPVSAAALQRKPALLKGTRREARASDLPGPAGETCRTCRHAYYRQQGKRYWKCAIAKRAATNGPGTDIRLKDPACARWEKEDTP